nr:MAG TPA: hypothetical protein [Caudoviricetes sp.]
MAGRGNNTCFFCIGKQFHKIRNQFLFCFIFQLTKIVHSDSPYYMSNICSVCCCGFIISLYPEKRNRQFVVKIGKYFYFS